MEEGLDSYKSGWQYVLHLLGLFTSLFYGLGTAVMVGFFVAQLALPLWALVPLVTVLVSANLFINMIFALDFTPDVLHWLVGSGSLFEGLYHFKHKNRPGFSTRFGKRKRSFMRMAFVISTASALAVSALTYEAMMGTLITIPMLVPFAFPLSIIFATVTTLVLATLFVNNWKDVVYLGFFNYLISVIDNIVASVDLDCFSSQPMSSAEKIATKACFIVIGSLSVLGFSFLFMVCLGPMLPCSVLT